MIAFNRYYNQFNFLSITLVLVSLLLLTFKGLNFGIDFKGGTLIELRANNDKINVSILPCSHELAHPKCDNSNMPGAVENTMNCSISDINADTACKKLKVDYLTIIFDWSKYTEFYGQGTRTKPGSKRQCKETNMISLAIDEFITNKNVGGKKKRKTRKLKKKSRKTKKKSHKSRKSKKKRKTTRIK